MLDIKEANRYLEYFACQYGLQLETSMKTNQKTKFPYSPFTTFCIRTPLLSLDFYNELMASDEISDVALQEHLKSPAISEAIYLASPELHKQLEKWSNEGFKDEKKSSRIRSSLLKYLTRMSTRCTPFGLFAAIGTGTLGSETEIKLKPKSEFNKKSHFDMHFLAEFANHLANRNHIKGQLYFYPNTSIYKIGKRYRYVEYTYKDKQRMYSLESVSHSSYLESILEKSKTGTTITALILLLEKMDIETEEATDFIDQLIVNQILVSELEPSITGPDFLEDIRHRLLRLKNVDSEIKMIDGLQNHIAELDKEIGNPISKYQPLTKLISELDIAFEPKYLLQTDTFAKYQANTLSYSTVKKIKQAISFFNRITQQRNIPAIEKFKTEFMKRHEHRSMPLLQILDVETGIGYGQNPTNLNATPFLDDIANFANMGGAEAKNPRTALHTVLQKKLAEALSDNLQVIELSEDDFPRSIFNWKYTADTISVMAEIVSDNGEEKIIVNHYLEHATRLIGRFGHGSNDFKKALEEITEKEAEMNPDHVLAEIVHLPEARTGNILRRPKLREFEIPYLGRSSFDRAQQIPLEDILVSIENHKVVLFSKTLNKPFYPRLSNAHNYGSSSLPVYNFLCDIQYQLQQGGGFRWPREFGAYPYLPRVVYKDCILNKASWTIQVKDIEELFEHQGDKTKMMTAVFAWRKKLSIPRVIEVVDGDNTLTVHLKNFNSICMFLETIKNRQSFVIEEFLGSHSETNSIGKDFYKQLVLSFYNHTKLETAIHG